MLKRRSQAFGLIQGKRYSLSEITKITNVSKGTLGNLKKHDTPLNKIWTGHSLKLSEHHKCQMVFHIICNHESCRLSISSIIRDIQLDVHLTTLKQTLKDLGYNHWMAWCWPFLKKLDRKWCLQFAKRHAHLTMEDWKAYI